MILSTEAKLKKNDDEKKMRNYYGLLSGFVGIAVNLVLFLIKFFIGRITGSVAISADAFNNLGDIGSSVVTIIGFKLASKPPDKEHPFGYGRMEYITSFLISLFVILIGFELFKDSFARILNPGKVEFNLFSFLVLIFTIVVKFWLGRFNSRLAKKIDSGALDASAFDSYGDVISTFTAALSFLLSRYITLPLDGYVGLAVSLFIMYSGYNLIKESVDVLIGTRPDTRMTEDIKNRVFSKEGILGIHDMMVHNYGPGRCVVTFHAEVPENMPVEKAHEIIDDLERELAEELGIFAVVHMDPVNVNDVEVNKTRMELERVIQEFPEILSFHDLRIVGRGERKNVIFDIVVSHNVKVDGEKVLKQKLIKRIREIYPGYNPVITIDREYV